MLKKVSELFSQNRLAILLILLGSISWSLTMVKSGLIYPFGLGFWGANGHDGIWHLALASSLARGSFDMPTFSGEILKNYHIGFDLIVALINRITTIPVNTLYFQVIPPILSILVGVLVYRLVMIWIKSKKSALWALFFVYFGGSFGFIIGKGESAFWSQQAVSSLINPPFVLSLVLMVIGLILLVKKKYLWSILFYGILIEVKAYAGVLALGSLLVVGIWQVIKEKKFEILKVFIGSLLISAIVFLPLNKGFSSLLVFKPFWFLETMMGLSDRIGWQKFYSAMFNYRAGGIWFKALPAYLVAFVIFLLGNLGTRVVFIKKVFARLDYIKVFMLCVILAGIVFPMFFLQSGTPWNTIQFLYYSLFFTAILAGAAVAEIKSKILTILIILLTLPTTFFTLKDVYLPPRPPAKISSAELEALDFLKNQPAGAVLAYPFDETKAKEAISNPPRPLYLYESTAYVSAFSNKPSYLEDQVNLDITGYDWRQRRRKVLEFVGETDSSRAKAFLKENNIKYLYLVRAASPLAGEELKLGPGQLGVSNIFGNKEVDIYRLE